ncbi:MAG: PolC-type DNA polymerase III [Acholeplasmataceae bacterium]|nr:PolC-type DNA polymerase III [Acholeplasmataceae bacterium]
MKEKMDQLLELLEIQDDIIREYGDLESLEVDSVQNSWFFSLSFEQPVPVLRYRNFIRHLMNIPEKIPSVGSVEYRVIYQNIGDQDLLDYYEYVIDVLTESDKRILPLKDYPTDIVNGTIKILVPQGAKTASMFRKEIEAELERNGFATTVQIEIDQSCKTIDEEIERSNRSFVIQNQTTTEAISLKYEQLYPDKPVENDFFPIRRLPYDEIALAEYRAKNGNKANFNLRGTIVSIDIKEQRSGGQANIILTDGEDSILIKKRLSANEDRAFFQSLSEGFGLLVAGYATYDNYYNEVIINAISMAKSNQPVPKTNRYDLAESKRVELHVHTKMSSLDGVNTISEYVERAKAWGHSAIAVTDHGSVQSYPDLFHLTKDQSIKPLYGLELVFVNDEAIRITRGEGSQLLGDATFVVFDIETTGLSVLYDSLIEIAGVKVKNGAILGEFHSLINPEKPISAFTESLTHITNAMVKDQPKADQVLADFYAFSKDAILVAHNADFDLGHLYQNYKNLGFFYQEQPSIDTLVLAKVLFPNRQRYSLDHLSRFLKVPLNEHHRALQDAKATTEIFLHMLKRLKKEGTHRFQDINLLIDVKEVFKYPYPKHINLLVKKQEGLKNLYKVLSQALTTYYDRDAKIVKSVLDKYRKGILVSSGCRNSDFFETAINKSREELAEAAKYYDFLEVQPPSTFCHLAAQMPEWQTVIQDVIRRIVDLGKELNIPVCATGDVHHLDPEDLKYREIMINTPLVGGGGFHKLYGEKDKPSQHFFTTDEMLAEFRFLGDETAEEIVIKNPNMISEMIDDIVIFPNELYAPTDEFLSEQGVPSIKVKVETMVRERAEKIYGNPLPPLVKSRMDKELDSIIRHQFSTIYYISHLLVKKSLDDGYLVGSRGSVGSSLVATFMDITEVNPLPPHYLCPKCRFSAFKKTEEERRLYGQTDFEIKIQRLLEHTDCGWDLPDQNCPVCNTPLHKDGHDIPFETFLGFKGDKVPDIDLNFSGDYQGVVHEYIRKIFGQNYAFRAGTIGTCASKTAYAMVRDFYEKLNVDREAKQESPIQIRRAEMERLAKGIEGSKRTSGQHPGGIVVVPNNKEIYDVTPVQYPGDSSDISWKTTHFDYHSFENNLFKLDVLGHDDPTMIRYLMDFVHQEPMAFPFSDPKDIPVDDREVYRLLSGTEVIGLSPIDIASEVASYGIPEFGTNFVRGMLRESRPQSFSELVKISGLSHGTDVWNSNAQDLISGKRKEYGRIDFKDIIGCRDDIMVDLINYGMPQTLSFEIMEFVRKGKAPANPEKWGSYADLMRQSGVPEWYIWSCSKIKYMFPKAHATAYVLMAMRIAWFKLYRPIYFYAAYFSKRATLFDADAFYQGEEGLKRKMAEIDHAGNDASDRDKNLYTVLELALEMVKRNFCFAPIDIHRSQATDFLIMEDNKTLLLPFIIIDSLGVNVANSIIEARNERAFISKQDIRNRTRLSKTLFERLESLGTFDGMIEEDQVSLFDFDM